MNILLDTLPETVEIDGRVYFVDTDFRTMIILEKIIMDASMDSRERVERVIDLVFSDEKPTDLEAAVNSAMDIYSCGNASQGRQRRKKNGDVEIKPKQIYDFEHDAPYIYGAFLSYYGIDLNQIEYLHWWKFVALFKSLPSDCKIVEIMGYRAADLGKIKDKDERSRIASLKRIYAIPQNFTTEDKIAMAGMAFGGFR